MTASPANRLTRNGKVLASASGVPLLTLDLLARQAARSGGGWRRRAQTGRRRLRGADRDIARPNDRLEPGPDRLADAQTLQDDPDLVDVVYGREEAGEDGRVYLQYWLWFYSVPSDPPARTFLRPWTGTAPLSRQPGAWKLVQIELEDDRPVAVRTDAGASASWSAVERALNDHPTVYVAPFSCDLYLDRGVGWRGTAWDGGDGEGREARPRLRGFTGWEQWPGRWGVEESSPRSPSSRSEWRHPSRLADPGRLTRLGRGLSERLARGRSEQPRAVIRDAGARLQRGLISVGYQVAHPAPAWLRITVHSEGRVVAQAAVTNVAETGEERLDVPGEPKHCEVHVSASSAHGNRCPSWRVRVDAIEPDELELALYDAVARAELASAEAAGLRRRVGAGLADLIPALAAGRDTVWRDLAADVAAFRETRAAIARRRHAADAAAGAEWRLALCALIVVVLFPAMLIDVFSSDSVGTGWRFPATLVVEIIAIVSVPHAYAQWKRRQAARAALRRWPDITGRTEHAVLTAARATFARALREKGIAPLIRQRLNTRTLGRYDEPLALADEGLSELGVAEREVNTAAMRTLAGLTSRMRGGSIGIAGPRGVGKSTLIAAYCKPRRTTDRRLTAVLAAPVQYDAREFVLALFAQLCRAVEDREEPGRRSWKRWRTIGVIGLLAASGVVFWAATVTSASITPRYMLVALSLVVLAGAAAVGLRVQVRRLWVPALLIFLAAVFIVIDLEMNLPNALDAGFPLAAALAGLAAGLLVIDARGGPPAQEEFTADEQLRRLAGRSLQEIRYQQTWSEGYSGKLSLPAGAELRKDVREDLARRQQTFPEIVQSLREFIALGVRARGGVVIGIDEMDKMESGATAERFLNEIKAIFGIDGCFYLVSVSENAMSSFERRGLPFRDVFDSSFDEVLTLRPLPLTQSMELLRGRVVGLAPPYLDLCHCLSGGLPRDLLRAARQLSPLSGSGIADVTQRLVRGELKRKVEAAMVTARDVTVQPQVSQALFWLRDLAAEQPDAGTLAERSARLPADGWPNLPGPGDPDSLLCLELDRLRLELAAFTYFLATVLEMFAAPRDDLAAHFRELESAAHGMPLLDQLAGARVALEVNPRLSIDTMDRIRDRLDVARVPIA
jgi:hypothetical protein